ncbi:MAG: response regulator [Bacteroidia bacterium]
MSLHETPQQHILIVEDDRLSAFLAEKNLEGHFKTTVVTNGHSALEAVEQTKFDAILMDINLGDEMMDGLRTMRMIKQHIRHEKMKIFAITSVSDAREWYIKQGFEDLIMKPINEEKIRNIIKSKLVPRSVKKGSFFGTKPVNDEEAKAA